MEVPASSTSENPLQIRVTPAGKIYTYVRHALDHLNGHPEQPVELHTRLLLPSNATKPLQPIVPHKSSGHSEEPPTSILPCTTTIPRLISVIEIVKREFLLLNSRKGKGLWQYNQLNSYTRKEVNAWVEQQQQRKAEGASAKSKGKKKASSVNTEKEGGAKLGDAIGGQPGDAGEPRDATRAVGAVIARGDQVLQDLLAGAKHPKMSHAPYMSITLSTRPLPHLLANDEISYQPVKPLGKKRRRKALTDAQRKLKKAKRSKKGDNTEDHDESEEEEELVEEMEEPEEEEMLEVPDSQVEESIEVLESLPKPAKKHKADP